MPEFRCEGRVSPGFMGKAITDAVSKYVEKKLKDAKQDVEEVAKRYIKKAIVNSPIYKGLRGDFPDSPGYDLMAEFGLTPDNIEQKLDKMVQILLDTVHSDADKTRAVKRSNSFIVSTILTYLEPSEYKDKLINDPDFSYMSRKIKTEDKEQVGGNVKRRKKRRKGQKRLTISYVETVQIEWMKWLLDPKNSRNFPFETISKNGDKLQVGITYGINAFERDHVSRSTRAVMTTSSKRSINFPYTLPKLIFPTRGENFIEDIAKSTTFRKILTEQVRKIFNKALEPRQRGR